VFGVLVVFVAVVVEVVVESCNPTRPYKNDFHPVDVSTNPRSDVPLSIASVDYYYHHYYACCACAMDVVSITATLYFSISHHPFDPVVVVMMMLLLWLSLLSMST
jgi:hypothetical protein